MKTTPRELRDLMNLCGAACAIGNVQPYAGGYTGTVADAFSLMSGEIVVRCIRFGLREQDVWAMYHSLPAAGKQGYTIHDIRSIYEQEAV